MIDKNILYNEKTGKFTCPNCNSHNVSVHPGMFVDLYFCNNCGYESRDIDYE